MIMVFGGAGASKAVNPKQYPTTVEFFERLPKSVSGNKLFAHAVAFLKRETPDAIIDIEQVLWALNDLRTLAATAQDTDRFPGWLFDGNKTAAALQQNLDGSVLQLMQRAVRQSSDVESEVNQRVYEFYADPPTDQELAKTWLPMLHTLLQVDPHIEVATTNYDLIIEEAIITGGFDIDTGRPPGVRSRLNLDLWDPASRPSSQRGLLTKLHGSVDWIRGRNGEIYYGTPEFTGQHTKHAIIYPGFKGSPTESPFRAMHDHLRAIVDRIDALIVIGFAFRDDYLNENFFNRLPRQVAKVIVDKGDPPPGIPFAKGDYLYLSDGFTSSTVHKLMHGLDSVTKPVG